MRWQPRPHEEFEPESIRVILRAHDEAIGLGHGYIGTEHLILGLLQAPSLARDWQYVGANVENARAILRDLIGRTPVKAAVNDDLPYSTWLKLCMNIARSEASPDLRSSFYNPRRIHPWHLLIGVLRSGGEGITILWRLGIEPTELERLVRALRLDYGPYMASAGHQIGERWRPKRLSNDERFEIVVGFKIFAEGTVSDVEIRRLTGPSIIGLPAKQAVEACHRFHILPKGGFEDLDVELHVSLE